MNSKLIYTVVLIFILLTALNQEVVQADEAAKKMNDGSYLFQFENEFSLAVKVDGKEVNIVIFHKGKNRDALTYSPTETSLGITRETEEGSTYILDKDLNGFPDLKLKFDKNGKLSLRKEFDNGVEKNLNE